MRSSFTLISPPAPFCQVTSQRSKAIRLYKKLDALYPDAHCALVHDNPLQLLISTMLSAQCTDKMVNKVTPALFERYKTVEDFAQADLAELEQCIRSIGLYRSKAKNIIAACRILLSQHQGEVPANLDDLVELPGVGRKTANVVLGNAFGVPGMVVDTHVGRISRRLGLTQHKDATKIEYDLMQLLPMRYWSQTSHLMITHGREVCRAQSPRCEVCDLRRSCHAYKTKTF